MNKPWSEMIFKEKLDWAVGELTLSIGAGLFRHTVSLIISTAMSGEFDRGFAVGEQEGYTRGVLQGRQDALREAAQMTLAGKKEPATPVSKRTVRQRPKARHRNRGDT